MEGVKSSRKNLCLRTYIGGDKKTEKGKGKLALYPKSVEFETKKKHLKITNPEKVVG